MDLQKMLDNMMEAKRSKEMKTSDQLMLGELILKLEAASNKDLPITFDEGKYSPVGLTSWRGSYRELAIQYEGGGSPCYEQPRADCKRDEFGDHDYKCPCGGSKQHDTTLPKSPKVKDLLEILKLSLGKYFVGYKGGDFTMGKNTPIWVANYGNSEGFNGESLGVTDIEERADKVVIKTKHIDY